MKMFKNEKEYAKRKRLRLKKMSLLCFSFRNIDTAKRKSRK